MTAQVQFVASPFDVGRRCISDVASGRSLAETVAGAYPPTWPGAVPPLTIILNGVRTRDVEQSVAEGDLVVVYPTMEEPISIGAAVASAVGATGFTATVVTAVTAIAITAAVAYGATMLVADAPSLDGSGSGASPSESWEEATSEYNGRGSRIPLVYGARLVPGTVVSYVVRQRKERSVLFLLLCISEGPIKSLLGSTSSLDRVPASALADGMLYVNETDAKTWRNAVKASTRLGTRSQRTIPGMNDEERLRTVGVKVAKGESNSVIRSTQNEVNAVEINLLFQKGLVGIFDDGSTGTQRVRFKTRYRLADTANSWSSWDQFRALGESTDPVLWTEYIELPYKARWQIELVRIDPVSTDLQHRDRSTWSSLNEITFRDFSWPMRALLGLEITAVEGLSGSRPRILAWCEGRLVPIWDGVSTTDPVFVDTFSRNPFWCVLDLIRNTRYGLGDDMRYATFDVQDWSDKADTADALIEFPETTTIASAAASGDRALVLTDPAAFRVGDTVRVDPGGGNEEDVTIDVLTTNGVGLIETLTNSHASGTTVTRIRERHRFDAVFDEDGKDGWSEVLAALTSARSTVVRFGNELILIRQETRTASALISQGMCRNFVMRYKALREQPNVIVTQFWNEELLYKRDSWEERAEDIPQDANTDATYYDREGFRSKSIRAVGVTDVGEVESFTKWFLRTIRQRDRTFEFEVPLLGLATRIGRVAHLQHYTVLDSVGGLILTGASSGGNTFAIDRDIVLAPATTYAIVVRVGDDTIVTRTIASAAGSYSRGDSLSITTTWPDDIAVGAQYALGVQGSETTEVEIVEWELTKDFYVSIVAEVYVDAINDDF